MDKIHYLRASLKPGKAPKLFRFNGFGTAMCGKLTDPHLGDQYFAMHWITLFFMPVVPLGTYLVSHPKLPNGQPNEAMYYFHAKISTGCLSVVYPRARLRIIGDSVLTGLCMGAAFLLVAYLLSFLGHRHQN